MVFTNTRRLNIRTYSHAHFADTEACAESKATNTEFYKDANLFQDTDLKHVKVENIN
jgi:hypothetical protein